jgi:hypothetical protein
MGIGQSLLTASAQRYNCTPARGIASLLDTAESANASAYGPIKVALIRFAKDSAR